MTVQRIRFDDPNPAGRILIDHRRQNLNRVLVSAINRHLPFAGGRMIAVRRLNFPDGISAVPQFREGQMTAGIGSLLLHERVAGIVNAEHSAGQRLAVLLDLFQLNLVDFIPDFGFPDDFSFACYREGFYRHIQRIPLRRIGFLERIRAGNKRNIRQLTVFIRIRAVNGTALRIVHFNQRTGQRFLAGNVMLGNRHRRVNQAVQDRRIQRDCDCLLRCIHVFGCQQHRVLLGIQQPAIRRGQFLDIIRAMRIHAGEGQLALGIRDASRHQRMGRQLLAVAVGNHPCIEQAEHTALAGNCLDGRENHAVRRFIHPNRFLLFVQRHPNRQIGVDSGHFHFHDRRLPACRRQREGIRGIIQQIAVRSGNFLQAVAAQRQQLRVHCAVCTGGQCFHQFPLLVENRSFLADNIRCGAEFKHSARQIPLLINRLHNGIAPFVLLVRKAHQLQAGLFQRHAATHGRVGHIHRNGFCRRCRNRQAHHQQHQRKHPMHPLLHPLHFSSSCCLI